MPDRAVHNGAVPDGAVPDGAAPVKTQRVRVAARMPMGHVRAPAYLRGKVGTIERPLGAFPDPERLAYGQPAPDRALYRVRFSMAELWGDSAEAPTDTVDAELYDTWLERLD